MTSLGKFKIKSSDMLIRHYERRDIQVRQRFVRFINYHNLFGTPFELFHFEDYELEQANVDDPLPGLKLVFSNGQVFDDFGEESYVFPMIGTQLDSSVLEYLEISYFKESDTSKKELLVSTSVTSVKEARELINTLLDYIEKA